MDGFCTPNWDGSFRSRHQTKEFGFERADRLDLDGLSISHFHSNDSGGWLYFTEAIPKILYFTTMYQRIGSKSKSNR